MPKISIIIPVYNTENYLRECLDSVIHQTFKDIEIILVNDGSNDNSTNICREYAMLDSRIKLIEQENGGSAAARKRGITEATGEYVGFVDSDDFIDSDMYETLLENIGEHDLITSVAYRQSGSKWEDSIVPGVYNTDEQMQYVIDNMLTLGDSYLRGISSAVHCKMFRTSLAKMAVKDVDLRVYYMEDAEFICRYILLCKSIYITKICKYHYRIREDSISNSIHDDFMMNLNILYLSLKRAFEGHPQQQRFVEQLQLYLVRYLPELPRRMGFTPKAKFLKYVNPLFNEILEKRIAIYGAGEVGQDYFLHMKRLGKQPEIWVDKRYDTFENLPVRPVLDLLKFDYEYVLIAVKNQRLAETIKSELISKGIAEEKILWKEPIRIM